MEETYRLLADHFRPRNLILVGDWIKDRCNTPGCIESSVISGFPPASSHWRELLTWVTNSREWLTQKRVTMVAAVGPPEPSVRAVSYVDILDMEVMKSSMKHDESRCMDDNSPKVHRATI
jgi:hypothetical protein